MRSDVPQDQPAPSAEPDPTSNAALNPEESAAPSEPPSPGAEESAAQSPNAEEGAAPSESPQRKRSGEPRKEQAARLPEIRIDETGRFVWSGALDLDALPGKYKIDSFVSDLSREGLLIFHESVDKILVTRKMLNKMAIEALILANFDLTFETEDARREKTEHEMLLRMQKLIRLAQKAALPTDRTFDLLPKSAQEELRPVFQLKESLAAADAAITQYVSAGFSTTHANQDASDRRNIKPLVRRFIAEGRKVWFAMTKKQSAGENIPKFARFLSVAWHDLDFDRFDPTSRDRTTNTYERFYDLLRKNVVNKISPEFDEDDF